MLTLVKIAAQAVDLSAWFYPLFNMKQEEERNLESWMMLDQDEINDLFPEDWEHYKNGGCLCFAHSAGECMCGAWWRDDDEINF